MLDTSFMGEEHRVLAAKRRLEILRRAQEHNARGLATVARQIAVHGVGKDADTEHKKPA